MVRNISGAALAVALLSSPVAALAGTVDLFPFTLDPVTAPTGASNATLPTGTFVEDYLFFLDTKVGTLDDLVTLAGLANLAPGATLALYSGTPAGALVPGGVPGNPVTLTIMGSAWVASQSFGPEPSGDYYVELVGKVLGTTASPAISVSITAPTIPEVPTWAMMGLGFAGLAFAGFRSRRPTISIT